MRVGIATAVLLPAAMAGAAFAQDLADARRLLASEYYGQRARGIEVLARLGSRDAIVLLRDATRRTAADLDQLGDRIDKLDDRYVQALDRLWFYEDRDIAAYNRWVDIHNAIVAEVNVLAPRTAEVFGVLVKATEAFASFRSPEAAEALAEGARHEPSPLVRQAYVLALGQEAHRGRVPDLLALLDDRDGRVRSAAVRALASFADDPAVRARAKTLAADKAWSVRLGAYGLVARGPVAEAVPFLVEAACTERGEIALAVDGWLEDLTGQSFADGPEAWRGWLERSRAALEAGTFERAAKEEPRGGERRTKASFFSLPIESERLVFVLDDSASMTETDLKPRDAVTRGILSLHRLPEDRHGIATAELIRAVEGLPDGAVFNIVVYSDDAERLWRKLMPATRSSRKEAIRWVLGRRSGSHTNIFAGLHRSFHDPLAATGGALRFEDLPDTIILLTDGVATRGRLVETPALAALVRTWNRAFDVAVHCVGIGKDHDRDLLATLAKENGGTYVDLHAGTMTPERRRRARPGEPRPAAE